MMKRFLAFILFFPMAGFALAQDMPPLPPMAGQTETTQTSSSPASMPPLPDQKASTDNSSAGAPLPDLPGQSAAPAASNGAPLPDLPGQSAAPAGGSNAAGSAPLPDLPNNAAASAPASTEAGQPAAAEGTPSETAKPAVKHTQKLKPWQMTKKRANVIFGGWVSAKGGNVTSRLSWSSQEVINALDRHKYKLLKEDGVYEGQKDKGPQWRDFIFSVPKSKSTVEVFLKPVGQKVWMRVGPSEPPAFANHTVAEVLKQRKANLAALHILQRKFAGRVKAHRTISSWEAPYSFSRETADR